jgi:hypothetical protein
VDPELLLKPPLIPQTVADFIFADEEGHSNSNNRSSLKRMMKSRPKIFNRPLKISYSKSYSYYRNNRLT